MKAVVALLFLSLALNAVHAQVCGGECSTSAQCANESGDLMCRCQNFVCTTVEDPCGGGCVTDKQCADWAGDEACICNWPAFTCGRESAAKALSGTDRLINLVNNIKTQKGRAEAQKTAA